MHRQLRLTLVLVAAIALAGCKAIGPGSVQRDRLDYANAIGDSWKEQALLNIVKLRYFDTPAPGRKKCSSARSERLSPYAE